jgi:hypothetical protein
VQGWGGCYSPRMRGEKGALCGGDSVTILCSGGGGVPVFGSLVWKFHEIVTVCYNDMFSNACILHPVSVSTPFLLASWC